MFGRLMAGETPVVRWRENETPSGFSKCFIMTIAVGSSIELVFLYLRYKPEFNEILQEKALHDVHYGNFIEWESTKIMSYLIINAPGIVIDVAISKKGVIYYSKDERNSEVGHCNYLDLNSVFLESPVLTQ
jgi:hypothetical protein